MLAPSSLPPVSKEKGGAQVHQVDTMTQPSFKKVDQFYANNVFLNPSIVMPTDPRHSEGAFLKVDLNLLKERLQGHYLKNSEISRLFYPDSPLALKDCYLQLALLKEELKEQKLNLPEKEKTDERDYILREYERIQKSKEKLEVAEVLKKCPTQTRKRIYIEGAAGAGKSTLCRYIAYQWATRQAPWSNYEWVFTIRLRELKGQDLSLDLIALLEESCFQAGYDDALNDKEKKELLAALQQPSQPVLFILDGLDELSDEKHPQAVWKKLTQSSYDLLITARPGVSQAIKNTVKINLSLAVIGFSDEQVATYVEHFFTKTSGLESSSVAPCLQLLKSNPNLWSLAHTPIQLELICSTWGKDLEALKPFTLSALYQLMLDKILVRQAIKQNERLNVGQLAYIQKDKRYKMPLQYMARLAFVGMQKKRIVLSTDIMQTAYDSSLQEDIDEQCQLWDKLEAIGLVKRYNYDQQAEFVHLTFQEYFAARFIAQSIEACCSDKNTSLDKTAVIDAQTLLAFITKTKFDPFYEVMWWFVAGLLAKSFKTAQQPSAVHPHPLQIFVDIVLQSPRSEVDLEELILLVRCLEEAQGGGIAQRKQIMANTLQWCEFYLKSEYELESSLLDKLWSILMACPGLLEQLEGQFNYLPDLLSHERLTVRYRAVQAIGELGTCHPSLITAMLLLFTDEDWRVRENAAQAVGQLGAHASPGLQAALIPLLTDEEWRVSVRAAQAVGELGAHASSDLQTALLRLLTSKHEWMRASAAQAVGQLGAHASSDLQAALPSLLVDEDKWVRERATQAVGQLGVHATALQTDLLPLLADDKNELVRISVAQAVGQLGAHASLDLQKALLPLLTDKEWKVRARAAQATGKMGAHASLALQKALVSLLADKDEEVRERATQAVGELGAHVTSLQSALLPLLTKEDGRMRSYAVQAVGQLGAYISSDLQEALLSLLMDKDELVRVSAAQAVGDLGAHASSALQAALFPLLKSENWRVRESAAQAVGRLGVHASSNLQLGLLPLLVDKAGLVQIAAKEAISKFTAVSLELQTALLDLIRAGRADIVPLLAKTPATFPYFCQQVLTGDIPVAISASGLINLKDEAQHDCAPLGNSMQAMSEPSANKLSKLTLTNVDEKTFPVGFPYSHQASEFARQTTDRSINVINNIHPGALVGNINNKIGNSGYDKGVRSAPPSILSQFELLYPRDSSINIRLFLIKAKNYHEKLKVEESEHIIAMRDELKILLDTYSKNTQNINKTHRDKIRDKIREIEEVKAEICKHPTPRITP